MKYHGMPWNAMKLPVLVSGNDVVGYRWKYICTYEWKCITHSLLNVLLTHYLLT